MGVFADEMQGYTVTCETCEWCAESKAGPFSLERRYCNRFPPMVGSGGFPTVNLDWVCGEYKLTEYWRRKIKFATKLDQESYE